MSDSKFVANNTTGVLLILLTATLWAVVPIALVYCLAFLDGVTITWFRFTLAAVLCFLWQIKRKQLNEFANLNKKDWLILFFAGVFLIIDYIGYTIALNYISPITTTIFTQATPFFLCIGGIIFFKERLSVIQVICFVIIFIGLALFFNDSLASAMTEQTSLVIGVIITVLAALTWVFYALLQKCLFNKLSSTNILLFIYILAIITLAPFSDLSQFNKIDSYGWIVLIFCGLNTVVAYGAFTQSMRHIDTTKVSTIIATIPLITIVAAYLAYIIWPNYYKFDQINPIGWLGIILVVGSVVIFNRKGSQSVKLNKI